MRTPHSRASLAQGEQVRRNEGLLAARNQREGGGAGGAVEGHLSCQNTYNVPGSMARPSEREVLSLSPFHRWGNRVSKTLQLVGALNPREDDSPTVLFVLHHAASGETRGGRDICTLARGTPAVLSWGQRKMGALTYPVPRVPLPGLVLSWSLRFL